MPEFRPRNIVICSCEDTMPLDADAVRSGCRGAKVTTARHLCRAEIERFRTMAAQARPSDHRLHAGSARCSTKWRPKPGARPPSRTQTSVKPPAGRAMPRDAGPKMAALLAAAAEPMPAVPIVTLESEGVMLIYGRDERAVEAGNLLKDHLDVTVLIKPPAAICAAAQHRISDCQGHDPRRQGASRRIRDHGRRLRAAGALLARPA